MAVHVVGAAVAWMAIGRPLPADRPELVGRRLVANVELTASWSRPSEPAENVQVDPPVIVQPQRVVVARQTFLRTETDVSHPTPDEVALARRLLAEPVAPARRQRCEPAESATGCSAAAAPPVRRAASAPSHPSAARPSVASRPPTSLGASDRALPELLDNSPPEYPNEARLAGQQGTVVLRLLVTAEGAVGHLEVVRSSGHPLLDAAAAQAVRRWRFLPATRAGQPIRRTIRLPVRFLLDD